MRNYDLNIWDVWDYETDGAMQGGWRMDAYALARRANGEYYQTHNKCVASLWLRRHDLEALGLSDDDGEMWWDAEYALASETPSRKVRIWLEKLMEGELDGSASLA